MSPGRFSITSFEDYAAKLKRAHVVLDAAERAEMIWADATNQAFAQSLEVVEDKALLAEVAGLVEWPVVLMGEIGEDFLELPAEVLQTSMKEHQKFFSVRDAQGRIVKYVTVANRETADNGATILAGNGKVLAARLSDAKFFWENDLAVAKEGMAPWLAKLSNVTFHAKQGSVAERIERIAQLSRTIAPIVGADPVAAEDAARIAKADLASEMVYEFPELQGVMGRYYALAAGRATEIAAVCEAHYAPLGPSDAVPSAPLSVTVALAEKIDILTGFWAIDEKPTGSKDPFALRRAALGVIRIILENDVRLSLQDVASQGYPGADTVDLMSFFAERLKVYLRADGVRHDVIDACFALGGQDDLVLLVNRVRALQAFLETEDGVNLLQGYKRANNILTQAEEKDGVEYSFGPDPSLAEDTSEKNLFEALDVAEPAITAALSAEDFATAMSQMATLRAPIDAFFTDVVVNAESQIIRRNRLNLLHRIRHIMGQVATLERIEG
jgi:glycyl-tRNA synthetase beta chain